MTAKRSIGAEVWAVAWPIAVMGWLRTGLLLCDSYFVGQLGNEALTALGACAFGWWMIVLVAELPATGVHALVAQRIGARDPIGVRQVYGHGLVAAGMAAFILALLVPLTSPYLEAMELDRGTSVHSLGVSYLEASLLGGLSLTLNTVVGGVFRGLGDTRTALLTTAIAFGVNLLLDPLLIRYMGIAGAAWATVMANGIGATVGIGLLIRRDHSPLFNPLSAALLSEIGRIGGPMTVRGIAFSLVYVALGAMIATFGDFHLGALGVGHRVESAAYMLGVAFEVGACTLVGQRLGAGDAEGARSAAHAAARWGVALTLPLTFVLFGLADPMMRIFSDDPATIASGAAYLRIQALVLVFMTLDSTYSGAFTGAGNTVPPLWVTTLGALVRLPLAWLFAWPLGLGIDGIWWSIGVTTLLRGLAIWGWFHLAADRIQATAVDSVVPRADR
ncbi:MAG: MATE family efflux transporter [Myxococcota bacterium]